MKVTPNKKKKKKKGCIMRKSFNMFLLCVYNPATNARTELNKTKQKKHNFDRYVLEKHQKQHKLHFKRAEICGWSASPSIMKQEKKKRP